LGALNFQAAAQQQKDRYIDKQIDQVDPGNDNGPLPPPLSTPADPLVGKSDITELCSKLKASGQNPDFCQ
jgi:hypothetical protein